MRDEEKTDPFDSADLYSCANDTEEYTAETPTEAILEHFEAGYVPDGKPLIVCGFARKVVDSEWITFEAGELSDRLKEDFEEEYGGDHSSIGLDGVIEEAVRSAVEDLSPFWCDPSGQREYSAEQVKGIWASAVNRRVER